MADRGRDLKVSILSDVDKFDAEQPARDLDKLAERADDAGKALKDLDRDTDKAGKGVDALGKDAESTAKKIDGSFDRIRAASKAGVKKVDDDARDAKAGLSEMGDEAQSTAKEAAASFSDLESGLDAIQEVAANAFAGFGPAGVAAGAAAAVGLGLVFSKLQSSTDQANALKDRIIAVAQAIDDAGGDASAVDFVGMVREWSLEIADNKSWWEFWQESNTTNLEKVKDAAEKAGVAFEDLFKNADDPKTIARNVELLNERLRDNRRYADDAKDAYDRNVEGASVLIRHYADERKALEDLKNKYLEGVGVREDAIGLQQDLAAAFGESAQAAEEAAQRQQDYSSILEGFVDPLGAYTDLLDAKEEKERKTAEKTAEATKDQKDSWEDYAKDVNVSIGEVITALQTQVTAAAEWSGNLATLAKRGVEDGVLAELERLGPEGAPLVASLAKATGPELDKFVGLMERKAALAGQKPAEGITAGKDDAVTAARGVHSAVVDAIKGPASVRVGVTSAGALAEARAARADIQSYFYRNPVTVPVNPKPGQGQGYGVVRPRP